MAVKHSKKTREQQEGCFTETEIAFLCSTYRAGAAGDVLIGLRQRVRLLTLLLPARRSEREAALQMERAARRLRSLECDGYIHARRARLRRRQRLIPAVTITQLICGEEKQVIILLDGSAQRWTCREKYLTDELSHRLSAVFQS